MASAKDRLGVSDQSQADLRRERAVAAGLKKKLSTQNKELNRYQELVGSLKIERARAIRDQDAISGFVASLGSQILPSLTAVPPVETADVASGPTTRSGKGARGSVSTDLRTPSSTKRPRMETQPYPSSAGFAKRTPKGNSSDSATSRFTKRLYAGSTPGLAFSGSIKPWSSGNLSDPAFG